MPQTCGVGTPGLTPNPGGRLCIRCGCWIPSVRASNSKSQKLGFCTTCADPVRRGIMAATLSRFEQRAAAGLPLFETIRPREQVA